MKRFYIFTAVLLLAGVSVTAQDLIFLKDGNVIEAKVTDISLSEIRYKRFDNLDGPTIVIPASAVLSVRYENGTVEVFNASPASDSASAGQAGQNVSSQPDSPVTETMGQNNPSRFFIGGGFSVNTKKTEYNDNTSRSDTYVSFSPFFGSRFGKGAAGLSLLLENDSYSYSDDDTVHSLFTWGIGIFGDFTFLTINNFSIAGRAGFQYKSTSSENRPDTWKSNAVSISITPIFEYTLFKHFALYASIGGISFDHRWNPESDNSTSDFGISIPSGIKLTDLTLGFSYSFGGKNQMGANQ